MTADADFKIERVETAPYGTNAYVVVCRAAQESVLVDAPGEPERIVKHLEGTHPRYILMTHSHFDHTGALAVLKSRLGAQVAAHAADAHRLPVRPDRLLENEDRVAFGGCEMRVLHTPGHTPGSLCFLIGGYLLSGDTLFPGGPGRTGTPADFQRIVSSLKSKIFILPDETRVFPGHGEDTVLKKEIQEFAEFSARSHSDSLCGDVLWKTS